MIDPGQSLDEKIDRAINDDFLGYYILAATLWVFTVIECGAKTFHWPRAPGAFRRRGRHRALRAEILQNRAQVRLDRKGRDGEREVAEILDDLKRRSRAASLFRNFTYRDLVSNLTTMRV